MGNWLGGFHVRVFAGLYPEEVVGMVLVDSASPDLWDEWLAVLPPESSDEDGSITALRNYLKSDPDTKGEGIDYMASADQVLAAGSLGDLPLAVATRNPEISIDPGLPTEINRDLQQVWYELQLALTELSSNSILLISDAGYNIHIEDPDLVVEAILWVLEQAAE